MSGPHPLDEEQAWRAALLSGSFSAIVTFLAPRVDDAAAVERALLHLLAVDEALAPGVGKAIMALPQASRWRVLPIAAADPRASVRRSLFQEWAPPWAPVPRPRAALLPPDEWRALLARALRDDQPEVRAAAEALAIESCLERELAAELHDAAARAGTRRHD